MDDLELLKRDWDRNSDEFKNYSEKEIFKIVKGKSLSLSKFLLIIGICEILFWFFLYFIDKENDEPLFTVQFILRCVVFLTFLILLIISFSNINNSINSKMLMRKILGLRQIIIRYVLLTFLMIIVFGILNSEQNAQSAAKGWIDGYNDVKLKKHEAITNYGLSENAGYFMYGITFFFALTLLYFIYKLIYGRILDRLEANYAELSKLEDQT